MRKRHTPHTATPSAPPPATGFALGRLALLLAIMVVAIIGGVSLRAAWNQLPLRSLARIKPEALDGSFRAARAAFDAPTRSGDLLKIISVHINTARRAPERLAELFEDARAGAAMITQTYAVRLQLAALTMLQLEQLRVPIDQWWPTFGPYFADMQDASFSLFLPEQFAARTRLFTGLGLGPGTARRSAEIQFGEPHGPFLQYLVDRVQQLAATRQNMGDTAGADLCRRLLRRVLRQWTLDPGPPSLRLLAADLLIRHLVAETTPASGPATTAPAAPPEVADALRAWRAAYRDSAAQRGAPLPLFGTTEGPELAPRAHDRLRDMLGAALWIAGGLAGSIVTALLTAWFWIRAARPGALTRRAVLFGLVLGVVIVAGGLAWSRFALAPGSEDLRRLGTADGGWPYLPLLPALAALALPWLAALWPAARGVRLARVGAGAVISCAVLSVSLPIVSQLVRTRTTQYEQAVAQAYERGEFEAVAGPDAARHLEPLRAWIP
ncbi:MAG TPA: hypothetical protein PLP66_00435 [Phycisphaerae bacterium]|nr:hypothetical protein [Phycisphaerae bacterium]